MTTPLRVLILEDLETDADLMLLELRQAGFDPIWSRVDDELEFLSHLRPDLDVILADFNLPQFDALDALNHMKQRELDVPFIVVTAVLDDEVAVDCMRAGATDYLLKDRLARLGPAVVRAVEERRAREERRQTQESLKASEERFRSVAETASDAILVIDAGATIVLWNKGAEHLYGYTAAEAVGMDLAQVIPERHRKRQQEALGMAVVPEPMLPPAPFEGLALTKDGREIPVDVSYARWSNNEQVFITAMLRDITERKTNERRLRQSFEQVQKTLNGVIKALGLTVEMRDPYTAGHQQRVAAIAVSIAREMALDQERCRSLGLAASVHDLGKITVPSEILIKPGRLSEIEMTLMRAHSQAGSDILRPIEFPWPTADIILQHHERLDGSGYPLGLWGEEILLEARIIGVADVIEAMSSHRPYRPALGVELAIEEVRNSRGTRYDPAVVDACLRILAQKGLHVEDYEVFGDLRLVPFSASKPS